MKEMKDYVFLYNMEDTSLAVDINFAKNMSAKFNLNTLHYFVTLASLTWEYAVENLKLRLNY